MKQKFCVVCGKVLVIEDKRKKTCSKICGRINGDNYLKQYEKTPKYKQYQKKYGQTLKYKKYQKQYQKEYYQKKKNGE